MEKEHVIEKSKRETSLQNPWFLPVFPLFTTDLDRQANVGGSGQGLQFKILARFQSYFLTGVPYLVAIQWC